MTEATRDQISGLIAGMTRADSDLDRRIQAISNSVADIEKGGNKYSLGEAARFDLQQYKAGLTAHLRGVYGVDKQDWPEDQLQSLNRATYLLENDAKAITANIAARQSNDGNNEQTFSLQDANAMLAEIMGGNALETLGGKNLLSALGFEAQSSPSIEMPTPNIFHFT